MSKLDFAEEVKKLIFKIHQAFEGVLFDDGIGIYAANALDDYFKEDSEEYKSACQQDQSLIQYGGWKNLIQPIFNLPWSTATWWFMDAKGRRFALPAFLVVMLITRRYEYELYQMRLLHQPDYSSCSCFNDDFGLPFKFSEFEYCEELFKLLTKDQIQCIRDFASFILDFPCLSCDSDINKVGEFQELLENINLFEGRVSGELS